MVCQSFVPCFPDTELKLVKSGTVLVTIILLLFHAAQVQAVVGCSPGTGGGEGYGVVREDSPDSGGRRHAHFAGRQKVWLVMIGGYNMQECIRVGS